MDSRWRPGTPERSPSAAKPPPLSGSTSQTRSVASGSVHRLLARTVHEHLTARRVGACRRGRGSAPAASPTRLNRRPVGGAQDEGVPLRRSAPPPPPPPAPVARVARANTPGYESVGESGHDALDQARAAQMFSAASAGFARATES